MAIMQYTGNLYFGFKRSHVVSQCKFAVMEFKRNHPASQCKFAVTEMVQNYNKKNNVHVMVSEASQAI